MTYGPASGYYWADINTSSRITFVSDARSPSGYSYAVQWTGSYHPVLTSISNAVGTPENYSFSITGIPLYEPFTGGVMFYPPHTSVNILHSITISGLSIAYQFGYDSSAEMTSMTTPLLGQIQWNYRTNVYTARSYREVEERFLQMVSGGTTYGWNMEKDGVVCCGSTTGSNPYWHTQAYMQDWSAGSVKYWGFDSSSVPTAGLAIDYSENAGSTITLQKTYTWGASSSGNEYVTAMTSTLNPFTGYAASTTTNQTVDAYGNLTQQQVVDYAGSTTGSRTYNMTYTASSGTYTPLYIFNRLLTATVTPSGGSPYTLSSTTYDGLCNSNGLTATSATSNHDSSYGTSYLYRGNPTSASGLNNSDPVCTAYDSAGVAYYSADSNGHSVTVQTDSTTDYSLPSAVSPNGVGTMGTSATYASSWSPASMTGPNGDAGTTTYDAYGRPSQTTIPDGATTTYTYTYGAGANTQTATVDGRWQTTSLDGFGRTIQVQKGNGSTVVSTVVTQYAPCACSPLGKMSAVSQPYAPAGAVYWTTYTYDGSGRTLTVTAPDGASTTTYSYQGNSTAVTDPAGHSKTSTVDAYGNVFRITEPNPAGGTFTTNYAYTPANQLTGVSMTRGAVTETRTYLYTGSDMTSSTNPENGTVTYVYDNSHHVTSRIDQIGQQTQYTYDSYGRLSEVQYFDPSSSEYTNQRVNYYYDATYPSQCPFSPGDQHGTGRMTGVLFGGGIADAYQDSYCYLYEYSVAGRVTTQVMDVKAGPYHYNNISFTAAYQWDTEGRMTSMQYPTVTATGSFGGMPAPMPTAAFQYDANGRLDGMTMDSGSGPLPLAAATYTAAGQLYQLSWGSYTETRTYNRLMQMTNQTVPYVMNMTYNYSATQNNGRVTSIADAITGETTNYTYDALNRLTGASNASWGETYGYDGFGNLTSKAGTGGSPNAAPSMTATYNVHNQLTTQSYDANGNVGASGSPYYGNTYTVENRLTYQVTSPSGSYPANIYAYDPWGKRVMSGNDPAPLTDPQPNYTYTFYGITGQKLATLNCDGSSYPAYATCWIAGQNVYFGKKLIVSGGVSVVTDRLGSVRANSLGESFAYYPYGEERTSTVDGREKFGTYFRDTIGQDYADQRYYNSGTGSFMTVDPGGMKTANSGTPLSWNRYAYLSGDPINYGDPSGLIQQAPPVDGGPTPVDCILNPDICQNTGCGSSGEVGFGFMQQDPDPTCENSSPSTGGATPTCGDAVSMTGMPNSVTQMDELAVLFGEDSWSMIGKPSLPGSATSSPTITMADVGLEDAYMVATMNNLAAAFGESVEWTVQHNQYGGFHQGWNLLNNALDSPVGSPDCEHLYTALAALIVGQSLNIPYTQWGAASIRSMQPGDLRIAGTDFFGPASTAGRKKGKRKRHAP